MEELVKIEYEHYNLLLHTLNNKYHSIDFNPDEYTEEHKEIILHVGLKIKDAAVNEEAFVEIGRSDLMSLYEIGIFNELEV